MFRWISKQLFIQQFRHGSAQAHLSNQTPATPQVIRQVGHSKHDHGRHCWPYPQNSALVESTHNTSMLELRTCMHFKQVSERHTQSWFWHFLFLIKLRFIFFFYHLKILHIFPKLLFGRVLESRIGSGRVLVSSVTNMRGKILFPTDGRKSCLFDSSQYPFLWLLFRKDEVFCTFCATSASSVLTVYNLRHQRFVCPCLSIPLNKHCNVIRRRDYSQTWAFYT